MVTTADLIFIVRKDPVLVFYLNSNHFDHHSPDQNAGLEAMVNKSPLT